MKSIKETTKDIISVRMSDGSMEEFERTSISSADAKKLCQIDDVARGIAAKRYVDLGGGIGHIALQISRHAVDRANERFRESLSPRMREQYRHAQMSADMILGAISRILQNPETAVRLLFEIPFCNGEHSGNVILWDAHTSEYFRLPFSLMVYEQVISIVTVLPTHNSRVGAEDDDVLLYVDDQKHCRIEDLKTSIHFTRKFNKKVEL